MPYAITVAAVSFVCYIFTGVLGKIIGTSLTAVICLPIAFVLMVAVLFVMKKVTANKNPGINAKQ